MNNKIKEFAKEHKKGILIGTGVCVGTFVVYTVGYAAGYKDATRAISRGIDKMWKANPELKELMWDAVSKMRN